MTATRLALAVLLCFSPTTFAANCQPDLLTRLESGLGQAWERAFGYKRDLRWAKQMPPVEAIQALLPIARGVDIENPLDLYQAHSLIRDLSKKTGGFPTRFPSPEKRTDRETLLFEPIESVEILGGGFNKSYLVHFRNKRKGVFKPFLGQNNLGANRAAWVDRVAFVREVTAFPIIEDYLGNRASREEGFSPVSIPETVETVLVFGRKAYGLGSMQLFVDGFENARAVMDRSAEKWQALVRSPDWQKMEARIRVLDYILGNPDRFSNPGLVIPQYAAANYNNLMLPKDLDVSGPLKGLLIDTAFGRPGLPDFSLKYVPPLEQILPDLAHSVVNFDENRFRAEFEGQLPKTGIDDVVRRVNQLRAYILKTP